MFPKIQTVIGADEMCNFIKLQNRNEFLNKKKIMLFLPEFYFTAIFSRIKLQINFFNQ